MRPFRLLFVFAAAALVSCASRTAARPPSVFPSGGEPKRHPRRDVIRTVLNQNVRVVVVVKEVPARSASGVCLGNGVTPSGAVTYVLTNAHVVEPHPGEEVTYVVLVDLPTGETEEFGAALVAQGSVPDNDLAILAVPSVALEPAVLAEDAEVTLGDDVVIIAAPYGRALSASGGMVSQVEREKESPHRPTMIKTDAAIGYGASGGGLYALESGKLLGIIEGYRTAKVSIPLDKETFSFDVPMPGETFAAPVAKIRKFLESKGLETIVQATPRKPGSVAAQ